VCNGEPGRAPVGLEQFEEGSRQFSHLHRVKPASEKQSTPVSTTVAASRPNAHHSLVTLGEIGLAPRRWVVSFVAEVEALEPLMSLVDVSSCFLR
jgi:hypothetical protein